MRVLIIGCGYVGLPLGAELVRLGHEVFGLKRTPDTGELARAGIKPIVGDITQPSLTALIKADFDWVVNALSSNKGGVDEYRAIYLETTRRLIDWLEPSSLRRYVYTSSTSV